MAKATKSDNVVEKKLSALYALQKVHSSLDRIRTVRGELPLEVEDLEDEIEGLRTRKEKLEQEIKDLEFSVAEKKNAHLLPWLSFSCRYKPRPAQCRLLPCKPHFSCP